MLKRKHQSGRRGYRGRLQRRMNIERLERRRLLAAIRVATYNVLQGSPSNATEEGYYQTILEAIGNEEKSGVQQAVDLLVLQETNNTSITRLESILDSLYTDDYAFHLSPSYSGLAYGFVYNTATLQLLSTQNVAGSFIRPPLRGHFQPIGAAETDADFYAYSVHLKADSSSCNPNCDDIRATEANQLRADADALGDGENVLIVGDFNMKNSFEGAYTNLTAVGAGQVFDPINRPGNWNNTATFVDIHTQDPGGPGGMDDRFDLQFVSGELQASGGLDYITGTYRAFGNNGSHALNGNLTGTGAAPNVLSALRNASDHIPVVADFFFQTALPGVTIDQTDDTTIVAENGYLDSYTVVLDALPDADVTVTVVPDAQVDIGAGPGAATSLTFTPQDYDVPQSITIRGVDDLIAEGNQISTLVHSVSSTDPDYNSLADLHIDAVVVDNETPTMLINEVDSDTSGDQQFIELYDGGIGGTSLTGKTLVLYDGSVNQAYAAFDLDGFSTDANGLFVIGNAGVPGVGLTFANGLLQTGADAVALYDGDATAFPIGAPVTATGLVDALVYDNDDVDNSGLLTTLMLPGEPQANENGNSAQASQSLSRLPDGGQARRSTTVVATAPTPGALNVPRTPGFVITGQDSVAVGEGGPSDSYTIALTSVPTGNVEITLDPDGELDLGAGPGLPMVLTFTPLGAMTPQTVTVNAFDDSFAEGAHSGIITHAIGSSDSNYAALSIANVTATIADNEPLPPPSVVISEIMFHPDSGGDGTSFSPEWVEIINTSTATQDISGWYLDDEDAGTWGLIPAATSLLPGQVAVLFDGVTTAVTTEAGFRSTWNIPAAALVIGVDWLDLDNDPSPTNEMLELKDDQGFVRDTVNFDDESMWPDDNPAGPSIYLTDLTADNNVGSNWARSMAGIDDAVAAAGFPFSILDIGSPGRTPPLPTGTLVITESDAGTDVSESGADDDFTIVLDANPGDDVVVTLTPDSQLDLGLGMGVAIIRTFTPTSGLIPQTIAVAANDDTIAEGIHTGSISFSTASNDVAYNGLIVADLTVAIHDNETAAVVTSQTDGTTEVLEGGPGDQVSIALDSTPTDTVTVTITPDIELDLGSGAGIAVTREFTPGNALDAQVVTVTAVDDGDDEGMHHGTISFSVTSNDANYDGLTIAPLTASIIDNDAATMLTLAGNALPFTGPDIYTFDFTVTAVTQPVTIVGFTIPLQNLNGAMPLAEVPDISLSDLQFTPHPLLELPLASSDFTASGFGFSISAQDNNGSPLVLNVGESAVLFSIPMDVLSAGGVLDENVPLAGLLTITTNSGGLSVGDGEVVISAPALALDAAPTVTDVKLAGSAWNSGAGGLFNFLEAVDPGVGIGHSVVANSHVVPWTNVDTIHIEFSEDIGSFDNADFSLGGAPATLPPPLGGPVGDYEAAGRIPAGNVSYDPVNARATILLTTPLSADKLILSLFSSSIGDGTGNSLDGDGDGFDGDDFALQFEVLPGDAAGGGAVTTDDVLLVQSSTGQVQGLGAFDPLADLDGSGGVNTSDVNAAQSLTGTLLPLNPPLAPPTIKRREDPIQLTALLLSANDEEDEEAMNSWQIGVDDLFSRYRLA